MCIVTSGPHVASIGINSSYKKNSVLNNVESLAHLSKAQILKTAGLIRVKPVPGKTNLGIYTYIGNTYPGKTSPHISSYMPIHVTAYQSFRPCFPSSIYSHEQQ
jgi:hypothetical protein